MDGLILVLIIIGLNVLGSSRKKKKAQEKANRKAQAFREAGEAMEQARQKIPFGKDEWAALLKEQIPAQSPPKPVPAKYKTVQNAKPAAAPARLKAAKAAFARTDAAIQAKTSIEHDEPEGSISTQGESRAEHAAHVAKIRAEEERLRQTQQTLQQLRSLNRQKLQHAVVMSEILDKPVSLRRRKYG